MTDRFWPSETLSMRSRAVEIWSKGEAPSLRDSAKIITNRLNDSGKRVAANVLLTVHDSESNPEIMQPKW